MSNAPVRGKFNPETKIWTGTGERISGSYREVETIEGVWRFDAEGERVLEGTLTFDFFDGSGHLVYHVKYQVTYRAHSG